MKVLYITDNFLNNNSGGNFANRAFINAFTEIYDICFVFYPDKGQDIRNYIHPASIIKGYNKKKNKLQKLIDIYRGKLNWYSDKILEDIKTLNPDIVVFDGSTSSIGLIKNIKSLGIKVITIHHNYEMEYFKGTPPPLLYRLPFMYYMKKGEKESILLSDLNLTLTGQDAELLRTNYDPNEISQIKILGCFESLKLDKNPNIIESEKINPNVSKNKINLAITGSLCSHQTEISLIPFIKLYYPILLKNTSISELFIAGRNPTKNLIGLCRQHKHINIIPNPLNIQTIIDIADVYICPTAVGGGLKLRVMDGLKAGLPVLAHTISARGYDDFKNAGFLFEYNDELSFERSLNKLLSERMKGNLDKSKIKRLYYSIFSFESGKNRLEKILSDSNLIL